MDTIKFRDDNDNEIEITVEEWKKLIEKGNEKNAEYRRHIKACKGIQIRNYNQKYGR